MTVQTTTAIGRAVLALREGDRLKAYYDTKGVLTIGVGHTSAAGEKVTPGETITLAQADQMFADDLRKYEATVIESVTVPMADHEFDACVSLCYNVGQGGFAGSTAVRKLNAGDRKGAADAFSMWEKDRELVTRREAERLQFLTPYSVALPRPTTAAPPIQAPTEPVVMEPVTDAPTPVPPPVDPVPSPEPVPIPDPVPAPAPAPVAPLGFWARIMSFLSRIF